MPTSSVTQTTQTRADARAVAALGDYVRDPNNNANCIGQGFNPETDVWHYEPETTDLEARRRFQSTAARACHGCPVRSACLLYALATEQAEGVMPGVWGGLPSWERDALIRRARANGWDPVNTSMVRSLLINERKSRAREYARTSARALAVPHPRTREDNVRTEDQAKVQARSAA
jgi:transcription factor WhiB